MSSLRRTMSEAVITGSPLPLGLAVGPERLPDLLELLRGQQRRGADLAGLVVEPADPLQVERAGVGLPDRVAVGGGAVVAQQHAGAVAHRVDAPVAKLGAAKPRVGRAPHRAA